MLMYLFGTMVAAAITYLLIERAKEPQKLFSKLAAFGAGMVTIYLLFLTAHYALIGNSIRQYYNAGSGTTFVQGNTTTTFYASNDTRVGEYLALQKTDDDVIEILSANMPIIAILLAGWFLWFYVETGLFSRNRDRVT